MSITQAFKQAANSLIYWNPNYIPFIVGIIRMLYRLSDRLPLDRGTDLEVATSGYKFELICDPEFKISESLLGSTQSGLSALYAPDMSKNRERVMVRGNLQQIKPVKRSIENYTDEDINKSSHRNLQTMNDMLMLLQGKCKLLYSGSG